MAFKINVSHKGKTMVFETENENLVDKVIGESVDGSDISSELEGYTVEITGTSDKAGFPGFKDLQGPALRKVLLTRGKGMWDTRKGVRLRKTVRGNAVSLNTVQINTKVTKEGSKKFESFKKVEKVE